MRFVESIEPMGKAETVCIQVAAEDSLYVTDDFLREVADAAGLDADKLLDAAKQPASQQGMATADQEAARLKVASTPTFTVTRDGKTSVIGSGVLDAAALRKAVGS